MCRIDIRKGKKVFGSINAEQSNLAEKIHSKMDIDMIILYGSFARGDFNEGSDIDLPIVADFKERFHKRRLTQFHSLLMSKLRFYMR
ncbi:nucleotidyltransferase domain-containing protein [Methanogenium sp. MK-MG]|uniref:nucleotidyltransferase domain-containing protein n=1 Tax=Methanogenium sp. MK-MG TaxID=2599926 RepID=UPI0013EDE30D|nr:nucleotidyltransferase domain-containing protein [Methanogenium sp. MK-MG]